MGGLPSGSMFSYYNPHVFSHLSQTTPVLIQAFHLWVGDEIQIEANVSLDGALTGNYRIYFIVCQDGLHGMSNMAIDALAYEPLTITELGQTQTVSRTFDAVALSEVERDHLRIVVLVQDYLTDEIAQGALTAENYEAVVEIRCDPPGLIAPWTLDGPDGFSISSNGSRDVYVPSAGTYTVTWQEITAWTAPTVPVESLAVAVDDTITFTGTYTDGPFASVVLGTGSPTWDVALIDYDNDGDLDVHAVNDAAADQLFQNAGGGSFSDVATGLIADTGAGRAASWADLDENGVPDVCVAKSYESHLVLAGDGAGGFTSLVGGMAGTPGPALDVEFGDPDQDGLVDIYIVFDKDDEVSAANILFKNYGLYGGFLALAPASGILGDTGPGRVGTWIDFDTDGRLDLYLVQYNEPNVMFANTDLGFEYTHTTGGDDEGAGVGADWGDFDNDGDLDLMLANADGNCKLYRNSGLSFSALAVTGLTDRGAASGVLWGDYDNDTNLDLYLMRTNGADRLLLGDGIGGFSEVLPGEAPVIAANTCGANGDIDGDGRLDIVLGNPTSGTAVLFNGLNDDNHWVEFDLTGVTCPTDALGARLVLTADSVTQTRVVRATRGANGNAVHFGLGTATVIDELVIYWPDGTTQTETALAGDRLWAVIQGENLESAVGDEDLPRVTTLGRAYPNPFNPTTTITFALAGDARARLDVYTVDGRRVATLADRAFSAGRHQVVWTGTDDGGRPLASGTYLYRLTTSGGFSESGRMALVK